MNNNCEILTFFSSKNVLCFVFHILDVLATKKCFFLSKNVMQFTEQLRASRVCDFVTWLVLFEFGLGDPDAWLISVSVSFSSGVMFHFVKRTERKSRIFRKSVGKSWCVRPCVCLSVCTGQTFY